MNVTKDNNGIINSELEKSKSELQENNMLKLKEVNNFDMENSVECLKDKLYSSILENKRLSEENAALKLKVDEIDKFLIKKDSDTIEELEKGYDYLKNLKIELNSLVEIKKTMKVLNTKFTYYKEVWRKEFELTKQFLAKFIPESDVNDSLLTVKTSNLISLQKKLKRLAEIEIKWKEKNDELDLKILELKQLLEV